MKNHSESRKHSNIFSRRHFLQAGTAAGALTMMHPTSVFSAADKTGCFIEAEHFEKRGGWVEDSQFVD